MNSIFICFSTLKQEGGMGWVKDKEKFKENDGKITEKERKKDKERDGEIKKI